MCCVLPASIIGRHGALRRRRHAKYLMLRLHSPRQHLRTDTPKQGAPYAGSVGPLSNDLRKGVTSLYSVKLQAWAVNVKGSPQHARKGNYSEWQLLD